MIIDRYYYSCLSDQERRLYKALYDGIVRHEDIVPFHFFGAIEESLDAVFRAVIEDNPQLFYFDMRNLDVRFHGSEGEFHPAYIYDRETCERLLPQVKRLVQSVILQAGVLPDMTEYEKVFRLYTILAQKISYDDTGEDEGDIEHFTEAHSILGVLFNKRAVCDGVAKVFKLLLNSVGIKCIVVMGKAITDGNEPSQIHSWNIVKIDGKPSHFDVTWAITDCNEKYALYDYFGLTDKQIQRDHSDFPGLPKCDSNNSDYYFRHGMTAATEKDISSVIKKQLDGNPSGIHIRLEYDCKLENTAEMIQKESFRLLGRRAGSFMTKIRKSQQIIHITYE